ncbi:MAG: NAD(P)H-dependent oxidoreductase [Verrucomicrobiota bacterium]
MKAIPRQQLIDALQWRYATKLFDPKRRISSEDWATLEQALILTPSSVGLQPWKFLVVEDPELRAKLQPASWGQPQIVEASHLVVFATRSHFNETDLDNHIRRSAEVRGTSPDTLAPLREMALNAIVNGMDDAQRKAWAFNQTYIALGNLLTSAALLGIDACPMEGIVREKYDSILNLQEHGLTTAMVATLGYRANNDKYASLPKVRFSHEEVITHL